MEWGPEIEVNGVRPAWLRDDDGAVCTCHAPGLPLNRASDFSLVTHIRLPAHHWAYTAIGKGFEPWPGGAAAPDDWDGGDVLYKSGKTTSDVRTISWKWEHGQFSVIGYRKKPEFGKVHTDGSRSSGQPVEDYRTLWEKSQDELATVRAELQESDEALRALNRRFLRLERGTADRLTITISGPQGCGKTRWGGLLQTLATFVDLPVATIVEQPA